MLKATHEPMLILGNSRRLLILGNSRRLKSDKHRRPPRPRSCYGDENGAFDPCTFDPCTTAQGDFQIHLAFREPSTTRYPEGAAPAAGFVGPAAPHARDLR